MRLTYLHHSGFFLETASCSVLFDFVEGTLPHVPSGKPLYVLISHTHHDHYNKKNFALLEKEAAKASAPLLFLLSGDVPRTDVPDALKEQCVFLKPHMSRKDENLQVETLLSNDTGVAFVLKVRDEDSHMKDIYFAGDLNAWNWDGDEEDLALIRIYHEELSRIRDIRFDVAFIPLDPRLGEERIQGITDFFTVCHCHAEVVVPMHCWGQYEIIAESRALSSRMPFMNRLLPITHEGQSFSL